MEREYARILIPEDCTGCFTCEVSCKLEHNLPVGPRWTEVLPDGPREIDGKLRLRYNVTDCMHYNRPPCEVACPAGVDAAGYVALISQGRFREALEVLRRAMPFAGVCGRVCTHPCELACERAKVDEPVAIRWLKRFMADYELRKGRQRATPLERTKEDKVAIIGSGPAGLACAYDLVREGYPVTVFEVSHKSGGLLRYAIPEYRLPNGILDNEISYIEELGVEIKTDTPVENLEDIFNQGYKAVFLGVGLGKSLEMSIDGEDTEGVIYALDFLRQVNSGTRVGLGARVIVIGGGSTAIDSARVSRRLGAKEVHVVCLESRDLTCKDGMLAEDWEIEEAEEEGVIIHPCLGPRRVLSKDGKLTGIETITCTSVREEDGTFAPKFAESPAPTIQGDTVIVAIGQKAEDTAFGKIEKSSEGTIRADEVTLGTNVSGVFAGGDVVSGPADVITAIAAGKEAALSIDRYLRGAELTRGRPDTAERMAEVSKGSVIKRTRPAMPVLGPRERVGSFAEVMLGLDEKAAIEEAKYCVSCGVCMGKLDAGILPACAAACPSHCISFRDGE
jgi:heterodisulfide reductase subunit A